jgi:hypothetical protein
MKTILEYLQDAKAKAGSDAALGRAIGVSQPQATRCLNGQQAPGVAAARKLAHYIGEREPLVVMAAEAARATDSETRKFWERLGKHLATTAGLVLTISGVASLSPPGSGEIGGKLVTLMAGVGQALDTSINYTNLSIFLILLATMIQRHFQRSPNRGYATR